MKGEVKRLIEKPVQIDALPFAAATARMQQHAPDYAVGAPAMLANLFEVAGQHCDRLVDIGALVLVELFEGRRCRLLELLQQLDRQAGEVVDEVQRVFDLVGDAGGQLPERGHLLGMDQIGLDRLQFAERRLRRVPRRPNFRLRVLALGHIAINQHEAAARHRVAAHLDDAAVRTGPLEAHFPLGIFDAAAQLSLEVA